MDPAVAILARIYDAYRAFAARTPRWIVLPLWLLPIFIAIGLGALLPSAIQVGLVLIASAHSLILMLAHHNVERDQK